MTESNDDKKLIESVRNVLSDEVIEVPSFWQLSIPANSGLVPVNFPDDSCLLLTNACLPEIPADGSSEPVRLFAHVTSQKFDEGSVVEEKSDVMLVSLVPGQTEHTHLNVAFSSLNSVMLENKGKVPIHLVGKIELLDDDLYGIEEEEEEEEEEAEDEEQAK